MAAPTHRQLRLGLLALVALTGCATRPVPARGDAATLVRPTYGPIQSEAVAPPDRSGPWR